MNTRFWGWFILLWFVSRSYYSFSFIYCWLEHSLKFLFFNILFMKNDSFFFLLTSFSINLHFINKSLGWWINWIWSWVFKNFLTCFQRLELFHVMFNFHWFLSLFFKKQLSDLTFLFLISCNKSSINLNSFFLSNFSVWSFTSWSWRIWLWFFSFSDSINVKTQISLIHLIFSSFTCLLIKSIKELLLLLLWLSSFNTSNKWSFSFLQYFVFVLSLVNVKFHSRVKLILLWWLYMWIIFAKVLNKCFLIFVSKFVWVSKWWTIHQFLRSKIRIMRFWSHSTELWFLIRFIILILN